MSSTGWESVVLRDVAAFASGKTPSRSRQADYFDKGTVPWVKTMDLTNAGIFRTDERITQRAIRDVKLQIQPAGTVLVAMYGGFNQIGRTGVLRVPAATNQAITAVVPDPKRLNSDYLLQSLNYKVRYWRTVASSSRKDPNITKADVQAFPLSLPSLPEQDAIAAAINDADDLIGSLAALLAKKQAMRQGMMQQLLNGRTRLPGFAVPWTWHPFSEVMSRLNTKKHQVPASSYSDFGRLPVIDQGQKAIVGYTNDVAAEFDPGTHGVVVFGDHTCITKFVDFNFAVGADGTQIVKAKTGNSTRFLSYALAADPVVSTGYNRHFKFLREKVLPVPTFDEQIAIVNVLRDTDDEIAALRTRLAKARDVKTGLLQQLLTGRTRVPVKDAAA